MTAEMRAAFAHIGVRDDAEGLARMSERRLILLQCAGLAGIVLFAVENLIFPPTRPFGLNIGSLRALNVFELVLFAWSTGFCAGNLFMGRAWRKSREKNLATIKTHFLSPGDLTHINTHHTCPDCAVGQLLHGPHGGMSINVKCDNAECRHEFSIAFFQRHAVGGERLDRDDPSLYREPLFKEG